MKIKAFRKYSLIGWLALIVLGGCVDRQREARLNQREAELNEREHQFALRQAEYQSLLKMRDSLQAGKKDTLAPEYWPADVIGLWDSKVVCIESDCSNYVIGDVRSDRWEFGYDSTRLITKVSSNKNLVRIYDGSFRDSTIQLTFATDSTSEKQVLMQIKIDAFGPDRMKGVRTVTVDNSCTAKFSVELTKSKNNPE